MCTGNISFLLQTAENNLGILSWPIFFMWRLIILSYTFLFLKECIQNLLQTRWSFIFEEEYYEKHFLLQTSFFPWSLTTPIWLANFKHTGLAKTVGNENTSLVFGWDKIYDQITAAIFNLRRSHLSSYYSLRKKKTPFF